jgi:hypothetical protein
MFLGSLLKKATSAVGSAVGSALDRVNLDRMRDDAPAAAAARPGGADAGGGEALAHHAQAPPAGAAVCDFVYVTPRLLGGPKPGRGRYSVEEVAAGLRAAHGDDFMVWNVSEEDYNYAPFGNNVRVGAWARGARQPHARTRRARTGDRVPVPGVPRARAGHAAQDRAVRVPLARVLAPQRGRGALPGEPPTPPLPALQRCWCCRCCCCCCC